MTFFNCSENRKNERKREVLGISDVLKSRFFIFPPKNREQKIALFPFDS